MLSFVRKHWFLVLLVVLIAAGLAVGRSSTESALARMTEFIRPRIVTALVLFLMSFSLDSRQLRASLRTPKPVLWASLVNLALIPLLAWSLMSLQQSPDLQVGLMIAASVPCTLATASVWTRKAGGNDAVSLLVTLLTNGLCFVVTPFWLKLPTSRIVPLPMGDMIWQLVLAVLIPTALGQLLRANSATASFATRHKTPIGVAAQALILTMVFSAALDAGARIGKTVPGATARGMLVVWASVIFLHLAALIVALYGARKFGFVRADCAAVAFSASQKTLPIGVLLATDPNTFGSPDLLGPGIGVPFAVFPILMYHASQLFIDTAVANRMVANTHGQVETAADEPVL